MEKINYNQFVGGEKMEKSPEKKLKSLSVVKEMFGGNVWLFKKHIKNALEQEAQGGVSRKFQNFYKMVWGYAKISSEDFSNYKKEVKKAIMLIQEDGASSAKEGTEGKKTRETGETGETGETRESRMEFYRNLSKKAREDNTDDMLWN